jgi:hypothetical protein
MVEATLLEYTECDAGDCGAYRSAGDESGKMLPRALSRLRSSGRSDRGSNPCADPQKAQLGTEPNVLKVAVVTLVPDGVTFELSSQAITF